MQSRHWKSRVHHPTFSFQNAQKIGIVGAILNGGSITGKAQVKTKHTPGYVFIFKLSNGCHRFAHDLWRFLSIYFSTKSKLEMMQKIQWHLFIGLKLYALCPLQNSNIHVDHQPASTSGLTSYSGACLPARKENIRWAVFYGLPVDWPCA